MLNSMDEKHENNCTVSLWPHRSTGDRNAPSRRVTRRAQEIASRFYDIPYSTRRHSLDRGQTRVVNDETAALIERIKREPPHSTGTALLRHLAAIREAPKHTPSLDPLSTAS